jgi:hypothetical protein
VECIFSSAISFVSMDLVRTIGEEKIGKKKETSFREACRHAGARAGRREERRREAQSFF